MKEFSKYSSHEKENRLMPLIISEMQRMGGTATREELKRSLKESDNEIEPEYISLLKISRKGNGYYPFQFPFNFSIDNLKFAGYLTTPKRGEIELTDKGLNLDVKTLDAELDVRAIADIEWKRRSDQNKQKLSAQNDTEEILLEDVDEDITEQWRVQLQEALSKLSPRKFEIFSRQLLKAMGVEVDVKKGVAISNDGGIDGFGYLITDDFRTTRVAIQAKRWNNSVPAPEIDKFRGAMDKFRAEYGIFITNADYTKAAVQTAREGTSVITLINGDRLADLVAKYQIHVTPVTTYQLDEFFD